MDARCSGGAAVLRGLLRLSSKSSPPSQIVKRHPNEIEGATQLFTHVEAVTIKVDSMMAKLSQRHFLPATALSRSSITQKADEEPRNSHVTVRH